MIETIILNYLSDKLSVPVSMEVPANPPDRYVVLEKTGSDRENYCLNTAIIAAQSYAESMVEAAKLNILVKQAIDDMIELNSISACRLNSDYNFTDTRKKNYRYQCIYAISYLEV